MVLCYLAFSDFLVPRFSMFFTVLSSLLRCLVYFKSLLYLCHPKFFRPDNLLSLLFSCLISVYLSSSCVSFGVGIKISECTYGHIPISLSLILCVCVDKYAKCCSKTIRFFGIHNVREM